MVVVSILSQAEFRPSHHRKDAPHFTKDIFSDIPIPDRVKLVFKFVASKKGETNMIIQGYVKEKFPLAYDYFESYGWKYCPISYKNLWGWKKQLEKGSLGMVTLVFTHFKVFFMNKVTRNSSTRKSVWRKEINSSLNL